MCYAIKQHFECCGKTLPIQPSIERCPDYDWGSETCPHQLVTIDLLPRPFCWINKDACANSRNATFSQVGKKNVLRVSRADYAVRFRWTPRKQTESCQKHIDVVRHIFITNECAKKILKGIPTVKEEGSILQFKDVDLSCEACSWCSPVSRPQGYLLDNYQHMARREDW